MSSLYYDREGRPIDIERFYALLEDIPSGVPYRVVAKDVVETPDGEILVSTVWLGANHNFLGSGPPILFETMVFGLDDTYQWRYTTEADARAGHADVLAKARAAVDAARKKAPRGASLTIRLELP